jgi:hypothetical protein
LKTDGYLDITNLHPDGSATWLTKFGQRIEIPPRPFLDTPDPPEPPEPPPPADTNPDGFPSGTTDDQVRPDDGISQSSSPSRPVSIELEEPPF